VSRFEEEKAEATRTLKAHHLLGGKARYDELTAKLGEAASELTVRATLVRTLQMKLDAARQRLRAHGLAIEPINKLLASYLGHSCGSPSAHTGLLLI
jgi:Tfp pilus assembly protein FimV